MPNSTSASAQLPCCASTGSLWQDVQLVLTSLSFSFLATTSEEDAGRTLEVIIFH
jgi:hypothetical protein